MTEQSSEVIAKSKYSIAVFTEQQGAFDAVWSKAHYTSCTKQASLTIFFQSFQAFSLTDSIET